MGITNARRSLALLVAAALAAAPAAARPEEAPGPRWYGWEIMLADAAALTLMAAGGAADAAPLAYAGVGVYILGGPVLHNVHGNRLRGALSGVLRGALPLGFGLAAEAACDEDEQDSWFGCVGEVGGAIIGGALLAMILDYAFLAHEPERAPPAVHAVVAPRAGGGVTLGLAGTF
jgi:hypothetical protein